jgi:hypothetical protein
MVFEEVSFMKNPLLCCLITFLGILIFVGISDKVQAQTEEDQQPPGDAAIEGVVGEEREVVLEAAITAEPARPLIQFTYSRSKVKFSNIKVGQRTRNFYTELRKGSSMAVGPPVLDLLELFPGLLPAWPLGHILAR